MSWRVPCHQALGASRSIRLFSSSTSSAFPRHRSRSNPTRARATDEQWTEPSEKALVEGLEENPERYGGKPIIPGKTFVSMEQAEDMFPEFNYDDTTTVGHRHLEAQRRVLHYFRLIEHEMPQLVAFRKPYLPPTSAAPVVVRSITYGGEEHPVMRKRVIVAKISDLPLVSEAAVHKFCVLAGPRWTLEPPKDSGFRYNEERGECGYIKISCEDFPEPAQNLKWASDTLDKLIKEANDLRKDSLSDVPLDTRHILAKAIKEGRGYRPRDYAFGKARRTTPPSIKDFPPSWLPKLPPRTQ